MPRHVIDDLAPKDGGAVPLFLPSGERRREYGDLSSLISFHSAGDLAHPWVSYHRQIETSKMLESNIDFSFCTTFKKSKPKDNGFASS